MNLRKDSSQRYNKFKENGREYTNKTYDSKIC
jgi:hypothetical protein